MNKKLKEIICESLKIEYSTAYSIYVEYCKAKGIKQEVFKCDFEGINALFDNPARAVYAFTTADIQPSDCGGIWEHIYINRHNDLAYCDDISEVVNLTSIVEWIFTLDDYERGEIFYLLDDFDIAHYITKHICKDKSAHYWDRFIEWLDDNDLYNIGSFVEEEWGSLLARFEDCIA